MALACNRTALAAMVCVALQGCGGGGDGGGQPGVASHARAATAQGRYFVNVDGGIGTGVMEIDAAGSFMAEGTTYRLAKGGPTGCTMTSDPLDPPDPVCNLFAGDQGFLLCENPTETGPYFGAVFLPEAATQAAPVSELAGLKLQGLTCGADGPRPGAKTLEVAADGSSVLLTHLRPDGSDGGTMRYDAWWFPQATQAQGTRYFDQQERWAIYKVGSDEGTTYVFLDLYQPLFPNSQEMRSRLFVARKP